MSESNLGRLVWHELVTTNPAAAQAFYTEVVGWRTQPWALDYTLWVGGQGPLGGVMALPEEARRMGSPSHWMFCVEVADVDRTVAEARSRGGRVYVQPKDVPKIGRIAVLGDPQGAPFELVAYDQSMPLHDPKQPGEFCWTELIADEHEAMFRFYSELFGWERLSEMDMGPAGKYLLWGPGRGGTQCGGMMTRPPERQVPAHWNHYIQVEDLDAALVRARSNGAKLLFDPMEVQGGGRIAQLLDPQGADFALHQEARAAKK
jgi:predicted enzyme related to lactoylglutathione lyase